MPLVAVVNARLTITCDVQLEPIIGASHVPDASHPVWTDVLARVAAGAATDVLDNLEFYDVARGSCTGPAVAHLARL